MTPSEQRADRSDRYAAWVALWRAGVRASGPAMGLSDLSTARFIELSPRAAELLGTTPQDGIGLDYLELVEPMREASEAIRLAREGTLDGIQARRRLRRVDGSTVDTHITSWVIRSTMGADLGLWLPFEVSDHSDVPVTDEVVAPSFARSPRSERAGGRVSVDHLWRVIDISPDAASLLGGSCAALVGTSLIELAHPDDVPGLLFALARATTDRSGPADVRIRQGDGTWRVRRLSPALSEGHLTPVTFVLTQAATGDGSDRTNWFMEAPEQLRRIADHIEAAEVLAPLARSARALELQGDTDLSPRQWEVVSRLVRGERVTTIAAEMYLSRGTVRNHLTAIFAKLRVHSQEELLALYHTGSRQRRSASGR